MEKKTSLPRVSPLALALAASLGSASLVTPMYAQAEVTGNIGVSSKYIFRGTIENENAAVQGGLDYAHESGFYAGYWGSSLGYGDDGDNGFENDFYAGFSGEAGGLSYDAYLLYYYYESVDDADTPELGLSVGFGPVTAGLAYIIDDVVWANAGDIYLYLGYEADLPSDFSFSATAGFFSYEDSGEFEEDLGTTEDSGFKHLDLTLSHPLGSTGADMSITYMVGGQDRTGEDVENEVLLGLTFGF